MMLKSLWKWASRALLVATALVFAEAPAAAVPAFARKYQTSCQTCHSVFPKLNAFGQAFRLRGYRMPGQTEEMVKEKPVSMGAEAYKRLWPQAVWPSDLSSVPPLAINMKFGDVNTSSVNDEGEVTTVHNDLQLPQEVNIFGLGTLGDHVSYFTEITFRENPDSSVAVELEHANIGFDSPFGPEDLFHFRIGKLVPNVVDGFQEMQIATNAAIDSLFAYNPIGVHGGSGLGEDQGIALPAIVRGIEAYGIAKHRVLWVAGLANGVGPTNPETGRFDGNNAKDVYARVDFKIGGMGFDGDTGGKSRSDGKNWRDDSLRAGVFVYRGDASGIPYDVTEEDETLSVEDRHFLRSGVFVSWYCRDLNVFGAYVHGTDTLAVAGGGKPASIALIEPSYHSSFVQGDYLLYPWLQATGRYETLTPAAASVESLRTGVFNLSALIRANVKAMVEYQRDLREGRNHSLNALVRFAF